VSLVVFPFKDEDLEVVASNLAAAAGHDRVNEVWAVAAAENAAMVGVVAVAEAIAPTAATPIAVFAQERIGSLRPGKGDGMNTALRRAAERGFDRVHFYDADITNFDESWIEGAEAAADRGYGVIRHRFPRAATDAMITWMVTRPGLALAFPGTLLPRIGQPLGGEVLLDGDVVAAIAGDPFVAARSDWGVDTILTYATAVLGVGIYEHHVADGKRHALYGSLTDIEEMLLECLDAVGSLAGRPGPDPTGALAGDPPAPVPGDLKRTAAYDVDATRAAISNPPSREEAEVLESLGVAPGRPIEMDGDRWTEVFPPLMRRFRLDRPEWRAAAFRLWVERVIHYTTHRVPSGYDAAIAYLEAAVSRFEGEVIPPMPILRRPPSS
jgi:mannosylglycerate synthase